MDFFGIGRWHLCERVPKNHEKDGDNRTARPEGMADVRLGAGVSFCVCSWESMRAWKKQRIAYNGTKLKAAIPTERIVGLCANAIRSEMNEAEMKCSVAVTK